MVQGDDACRERVRGMGRCVVQGDGAWYRGVVRGMGVDVIQPLDPQARRRSRVGA